MQILSPGFVVFYNRYVVTRTESITTDSNSERQVQRYDEDYRFCKFLERFWDDFGSFGMWRRQMLKNRDAFANVRFFSYLCMQIGIVISNKMRISPSTYRKLYTIDRTIRMIMRICSGIWLVLIIAVAIPTPHRELFAYAFFITLGVICLLAIVRMCLSPFVKSDEEEEMEEKVEYILKKHHTHLLQGVQDEYSPLCNLAPEQEERVKKLLHDLPSNSNKPDYISPAHIANHMKALELLGKARLNNVYALQSWVERVTGKRTPEYREFNEAIQKAKDSKVAKAREAIERILQ